MTRITSLLTIPLAIVFGLTLGATGAGAGHSRSNCEQRIFQKDETEACFDTNVGIYFFRKAEEGGFSLFAPGPNLDCECQLWRKNDLICAGQDRAFIAGADRRGRRLFGELLDTAAGEHIKITGKRVDDINSCRS